MKNLAARMEALSQSLAKRRVQPLEADIAELLPDANVSFRGSDELIVEGRGLRRRWMHEAGLRFLGKLGA